MMDARTARTRRRAAERASERAQVAAAGKRRSLPLPIGREPGRGVIAESEYGIVRLVDAQNSPMLSMRLGDDGVPEVLLWPGVRLVRSVEDFGT